MGDTVPFEGVEKRLVVQFTPELLLNNDFYLNRTQCQGEGKEQQQREEQEQEREHQQEDAHVEGMVRSPYDLSEEEWSEILNDAGCTIVSKRELSDHKVYLLSESTLTVWKSGFLMKTCGRTTPFLALNTYLKNHLVKNHICQEQACPEEAPKPAPGVTLETQAHSPEHNLEISGLKVELAQCGNSDKCGRNAQESAEVFASVDGSEMAVVGITSDNHSAEAKNCPRCLSLYQQAVNWMTYSRLQFIHPKYQIWPHQNFQQETRFLKSIFPQITSNQNQTPSIPNPSIPSLSIPGSIHPPNLSFNSIPAGENVLHTAFWTNGLKCKRSYHMEEALMLGVQLHCVRQLTGADHMTERDHQIQAHNIPFSPMEQSILGYQQQQAQQQPNAQPDAEPTRHLDQFWFHPCGYSCNALMLPDRDAAPSTASSTASSPANRVQYFSCHISPEPATSYASFELGREEYSDKSVVNLDSLISCIGPKHLQLTRITVDCPEDAHPDQEQNPQHPGVEAKVIVKSFGNSACRMRVSHTYVPWLKTVAVSSGAHATNPVTDSVTHSVTHSVTDPASASTEASSFEEEASSTDGSVDGNFTDSSVTETDSDEEQLKAASSQAAISAAVAGAVQTTSSRCLVMDDCNVPQAV